MTANPKTVLEAALSLPADDRVELAERLIHSLDETEQAAVEAAWNEEIDRRLAAIENGTATLLTHEEALRPVKEARKE